jgi:leucyl aminopeptidase (aminopeptidase T)
MVLKNEELLIIGDYGIIGRRLSPLLTLSYYLAAKSLGVNDSIIMQGVKDSSKDADMEVINALKNLKVKKSAVILNVSNKIGGFKSLGRSFRRYMKYKNTKFVSTSGLGSLKTAKIFSVIKAYDINYVKLKKKQAQLKRKLDAAREVRFVTKGGTDIIFDVKGRKAISVDGDYSSKYKGGNMPAGEVYMAPNLKGANGTLIIDGSSRVSEGTILIKKPIQMTVRNGMVVELKGKRVAEVGIGMNPNAKLVGAMVVDEKSLGTVHIALGSNYWFGGPIRSIIHLDQVMKDAKIYIDGKEYILPRKKDLR